MKCEVIADILEEQYPKECAEEWDNPGLLVGRGSAEVERIFVTLDVTEEAILQAEQFGAQLIVAHHPVIFGGIKSVTDSTPAGRRCLMLAEKGIACYCMHTNFDIKKMGTLNAMQLGLVNTVVLSPTGSENGVYEGFGAAGSVPGRCTLRQFAEYVKNCLELDSVRYYGDDDMMIDVAAVCGGSGKSFIPEAKKLGANVLVTGDIDHHTALDALSEGIALIDAGHYGTEYEFVPHMTAYLRSKFPDLKVAGAAYRESFRVI